MAHHCASMSILSLMVTSLIDITRSHGARAIRQHSGETGIITMTEYIACYGCKSGMSRVSAWITTYICNFHPQSILWEHHGGNHRDSSFMQFSEAMQITTTETAVWLKFSLRLGWSNVSQLGRSVQQQKCDYRLHIANSGNSPVWSSSHWSCVRSK